MEPKLPVPNRGPERLDHNYDQTKESIPTIPTPENIIERKVERFEQKDEPTVQPIVPPILPMPVIAPPVPTDTDTTSMADDDSPLIANDDDLIEKEWVEKAKKIITDTKDDPYRREQEVGRLQADYLLKRYGKELGAPQ